MTDALKEVKAFVESNDSSVVIEYDEEIEIEIEEDCFLRYSHKDSRTYIYYIDMTIGEEIEIDLEKDIIFPFFVNEKVSLTQKDYDYFQSLIKAKI